MKDLSYIVGTLGRPPAEVQLDENLKGDQLMMATAATKAFKAMAVLAKSRGRFETARAGFSVKWQNAIKTDAYPDRAGAVSLEPGMRMRSKIQYAGIFEDGGIVRGTPYMWLPVEGLAPGLNINNFEGKTGQDLVPFRDPHTGTLLMGVRIKVNKNNAKTKLSLTRIKRGATAKQGVLTTVPVFVGVKQITQTKKFHLHEVMQTVADELPTLYANNREALDG